MFFQRYINSFHSCAASRRGSSAVAAILIGLSLVVPAATAGAAESGKFHLEEATIADIQRAILAKQITSTQLLKLYLKRIQAYNGLGVEEPNGMLGKVKIIPHAKGIN